MLELFFDIFAEGIVELIGYCYIKLMTLIVPDKRIPEGAKKTVKWLATAFAGLLGIALVIGLILLIQEDPFIQRIGKYTTYISLAIIALQIVLGSLGKIISRIRK